MKLSNADLQNWLRVLTSQPKNYEDLLEWVTGPLKEFFPFARVLLGHGEFVAGQIQVTHVLTHGHDDAYLKNIGSTFNLETRGSMKWWLTHRQPFTLDPICPPTFATPFEVKEIRDFNLGCIAAHGILNARTNAGTYFSFAGIPTPTSDWHLDALTLIAPVLNDLFLGYVATRQKDLSLALAKLTSRQNDVVRLIVTGMDDKRIARELGIAQKTVRNQLTDIYRLLDIHKRAQLISMLR